MRHFRITLFVLGVIGANANAQEYVIMPDSTNNRLVAFSAFDGSVMNANVFALAGGTPVHAMQVGNEIWVSEQLGDRVSRWSFTGTSLGAVTGQMDNIRGMELKDGVVYVCNDGTGNGAPGESLRMFTTGGTSLGHFVTPASSPFGILSYGANLLVSSDAANDDVHQYTTGGASVGTFHNSSTLNFAEQMNYDVTGNILVAGFSSNNVVVLNGASGAVVKTYSASGARGVLQLGNGNILWSNSSGAHVINVNTGASTQVYQGGGRYFEVVPEPATMTAMAAASLIFFRRRRR
ncbi:MAG: hypothetical protein HONBIEJF_00224 [Fimbriimonadaceae bacterium]|nr:hypothetical protein [Fimbriimonadaceae bacterium]